MKIQTILKLKGSNVFTISPDSTVADAAYKLKDKKIGALVVTENNSGALGIISEKDIVRAYAERGLAFADLCVSEVMTPNPITCSLTDSGDELMDLMTKHLIRHVPVVEGSTLQGMISLGDVVKHRLNECLVESDDLKRYINST